MRYLILILLLTGTAQAQDMSNYMEQLMEVEGIEVVSQAPDYSQSYRFYVDKPKNLFYPQIRQRAYDYVGNRKVANVDIYKRRSAYIMVIHYAI